MIIAIDFDGTCVTHAYPAMGKDVGAVPVIKRLVARGDQIILYTMRSGKTLQDAVDWFTKNGIVLFGINNNPEQSQWTQSPKIYANLYIDDASLGAPLIHPPMGRPWIDWSEVAQLLGVAD